MLDGVIFLLPVPFSAFSLLCTFNPYRNSFPSEVAQARLTRPFTVTFLLGFYLPLSLCSLLYSQHQAQSPFELISTFHEEMVLLVPPYPSTLLFLYPVFLSPFALSYDIFRCLILDNLIYASKHFRPPLPLSGPSSDSNEMSQCSQTTNLPIKFPLTTCLLYNV